MSGILKKIIQKTANLFGYKIISHSNTISNTIDIDRDEDFVRIWNKCKEQTMTSKERMFALYKAVEYAVKYEVPGDFVECGVWRGGSAMLIAYTLGELNAKNRKIYLYDTFEGMTRPTENDYSALNKNVSIVDKWEKEQKEGHNEWAYASLSEVKKNMAQTKYPENNIIFIKGKVEETIPKIMPPNIALLRLDTDWYESTKHELTYLFPLLVKNGVLIIDDYGHWAGSKKAVDEYFAVKPIFLNRIDYTARMGIKTD